MEFLMFVFFPVIISYLIYKAATRKFDYVINEIVSIAMILYFLYLIYIVWFYRAHMLFEDLEINLIPFYTIFSYISKSISSVGYLKIAAINIIGNIIMTLPIGLWLHFNQYKLKKVITLAVLLPLIIETGQFLLHIIGFTTRSVDVDDIILNFTGIIIGYLLAKRTLPIKKPKYKG